MAVFVVMDKKALSEALADLRSYQGPEMDKRIRKATLAGAKSLEDPIRGATPVNHGKKPGGKYPHDLRGSVRTRHARAVGKWVGYKTGPGGKTGFYASAVIGGAKPHLIGVPKTSGLGKRFIHHPGVRRGNPYVDAVGKAQEDRVTAAMAKSIVTQRTKAGF